MTLEQALALKASALIEVDRLLARGLVVTPDLKAVALDTHEAIAYLQTVAEKVPDQREADE